MYGRGVMSFNNGDKYYGEFRNDLKSGYGLYIHENGLRYEGQWSKDLQHGIGEEENIDSVYSG